MTRSTSRSALPETDYFAPDFAIEVEGEPVHPERKGDIVNVKVSLGITELGGCEITLNNWDDEQRDFRTGYDIGGRVVVKMGYADLVTTVFHGQVTRIAPRFPDSGAPTMVITCLDGLVKLRDRQPRENESHRYENKADWEIAAEIAQRHGFDFVGSQAGPTHELVWQRNQDDASFLMERASRIDFDCFLAHDASSQRETLHFVQPTDGRSADHTQVYVLEYQKNLSSFTPQIDLGEQVSEVTVRGWSPSAKDVISYTATASDLPSGSSGTSRTGPSAAQRHLGNRAAQVIDADVSTEQEARELAIAILRNRAYRYVTADGQMIGLPNLRPGHNLEILNVGALFAGTYYVNSVEHTIGEQGYRTSFKVRRFHTGDAS